jgi:AcrR family transcriptional regulator
MGLRELKKEQTRRLIADTAWRLFADRGFDRVTVAEVARAAQVAEKTVFNYFPSKEDLFFSRMEAFGSQLVDAVANRAPGETPLAPFRRFLLEPRGLMEKIEAGDPEAWERLKTVNRMVAASPALRARQLQTIESYTGSLSEVIAAETGDAVGARVAATALMGVHRALLEYVLDRVLTADEPGRLPADVRRVGKRAFALLEAGLSDYAPRR